MTTLQIKRLDKLFQSTVLRLNPNSIFGGRASEIHHFFGRTNMSTRWYKPNGIPVSREQHNLFESVRGKEMEEKVIKIKGREWYDNLRKQANLIVKNISYDKVLAHLSGRADNYI